MGGDTGADEATLQPAANPAAAAAVLTSAVRTPPSAGLKTPAQLSDTPGQSVTEPDAESHDSPVSPPPICSFSPGAHAAVAQRVDGAAAAAAASAAAAAAAAEGAARSSPSPPSRGLEGAADDVCSAERMQHHEQAAGTQQPEAHAAATETPTTRSSNRSKPACRRRTEAARLALFSWDRRVRASPDRSPTPPLV